MPAGLLCLIRVHRRCLNAQEKTTAAAIALSPVDSADSGVRWQEQPELLVEPGTDNQEITVGYATGQMRLVHESYRAK